MADIHYIQPGLRYFIAGTWMSTKLFAGTDIKASLEWLLSIIVSLFILSIIKVLGWQQIQKLETLSEIKRLKSCIILILGQSKPWS